MPVQPITKARRHRKKARHDALEAASASAADADAREILRDSTRGPRLLECRGDAEPGAIPPAARLEIWREHARCLLGTAPAGGRVRVRVAGGDEARRTLAATGL